MSDVLKPVKVEFIESYIKGVNGSDYQWNDNHGELIRCINCINNSPFGCGKLNLIVTDDFYCGFGVKKDG